MPSVLHRINMWIKAGWESNPELADVYMIFDGIGASSVHSHDLLMLGDDGDPDTEVSSEFSQMYVDLAQTRRQETGVIPCAVIAQDGGSDQPLVETRAFEILTKALALFENDRTMGGLVYSCEVLEGSKRTLVNSQGIAVIVPFNVNYWASV